MNDDTPASAALGAASGCGGMLWLLVVVVVVISLMFALGTMVAPLGELRRLDEQQQQDIVIR